jgi:hypothetical protein
MSMAVEPDSTGVRFPTPFVYLGALLLGLAAERFVPLPIVLISFTADIFPGAECSGRSCMNHTFPPSHS